MHKSVRCRHLRIGTQLKVKQIETKRKRGMENADCRVKKKSDGRERKRDKKAKLRLSRMNGRKVVGSNAIKVHLLVSQQVMK